MLNTPNESGPTEIIEKTQESPSVTVGDVD